MSGYLPEVGRWSNSTGFDDATVIYAAAAHQCFQQLQDAASRLAAILLLMTFEKSRHALDHASRESAVSQIAEGREKYRTLRPTVRAAHFHRHLGAGLQLLDQCSDAIERTLAGAKGAIDPLPILTQGWKELESASRCLPGFEVVDFSHSCCANHAPDQTRF